MGFGEVGGSSLILVGLALLQGLSLLCVFCSSWLGAGLSRAVAVRTDSRPVKPLPTRLNFRIPDISSERACSISLNMSVSGVNTVHYYRKEAGRLDQGVRHQHLLGGTA